MESKVTTIEDNSIIVESVKKDFGINLVSVERVPQGHQNQVYKAVTKEKKTFFIRMNNGKINFAPEILGYKIFKTLDIPVPEIISYMENPPTLKQPTMILSSAPGTSLYEAKIPKEEEMSVYESLGRIISKINSIKLKGFGPAIVNGEELQGKFGTYSQHSEKIRKSADDFINVLVSNGMMTEAERERVTVVVEEICNLKFGRASLLHRDVNKGHVFVQNGQISGLIDLGRLEAGDPRNEIGKVFIFLTPEQREYFIKGYGELAKDPMVNKYLIIRSATLAASKIKRGQNELAQRYLEVFKEALKTSN